MRSKFLGRIIYIEMNAKEARKVAMQSSTSDYHAIMELIEKAAGNKKLEVWYYNHVIEKPTRDLLIEEGFTVGETQFDRNDMLTKISW